MEDNQRVDFAWRVHSALDSWTTKVDQKASIVLALETGILALVVTFSERGRPLGDLASGSAWLFRVGVAFLIAGGLFAAAAVAPQLASRSAQRMWRDNTIYFGHLRHWNPKELLEYMKAQTTADALEQLSRQHVTMSQILWRKHRLLQTSVVTTAAGLVFLFLSTL